MSRYLHIVAINRPSATGSDNNGRTLFTWDVEATAAATVADWELEIAQVIVDAGLGTLGTDIFIGPEAPIPPTGAGPYTQINDTGGTQPLESHGGDEYERLSAQITVRADKYTTARTRALAIWRELHGQRNATITAA